MRTQKHFSGENGEERRFGDGHRVNRDDFDSHPPNRESKKF